MQSSLILIGVCCVVSMKVLQHQRLVRLLGAGEMSEKAFKSLRSPPPEGGLGGLDRDRGSAADRMFSFMVQEFMSGGSLDNRPVPTEC